MLRSLLPLLFGPVLASACTNTLPPTGQLRLHVVTDGPVPGDPEVPAFFDRVEAAIVTSDGASACDDCTRTLVLSKARLETGISFGLVPRPGRDDLVLHARMFLSRHGLELNDDAIVESWTRMPSVSEDGILDVSILLPIARVGSPIGSLEAPVEPTLGLPDPSLVSSFTAARRRPCTGASPEGAVCVPGGASWMGDVIFRDVARSRQGGLRRIIVVKPFHLDATEVTVGAFRKSGLATVGEPGRTVMDGSSLQFCTYSDSASPEVDVLPVSCLTRQKALAFCAKRGGQLPTEAQYAYVQGGLKGMPYVWGDSLPTCEDAAWGRIPAEYVGTYPGDCVRFSKRPGAQPVGQGLLDRLDLGGGVIVDLAGNVMEYALDDFEADGGECWPRGVLVDPVCLNKGGTPAGHGGSVFHDRIDMRSGQRGALPYEENGTTAFVSPQVGFRCAYEDR